MSRHAALPIAVRASDEGRSLIATSDFGHSHITTAQAVEISAGGRADRLIGDPPVAAAGPARISGPNLLSGAGFRPFRWRALLQSRGRIQIGRASCRERVCQYV